MNRPIGRDEAVPAPSAGDDPGTFQRPLSAMLGLPLAAFAIAVALGTPLLGRPSLVEPVAAAFGVLVIWIFTLNLGVRPKPPVLAAAGLDGDAGEAGVGAAVATTPRHTLPERLVFAARNAAAVGALLMLAAPVMMIAFVGICFVLSLISACSAEAAIWFEVHASGDGDGDGDGDGGGDGGGD